MTSINIDGTTPGDEEQLGRIAFEAYAELTQWPETWRELGFHRQAVWMGVADAVRLSLRGETRALANLVNIMAMNGGEP